MVGSRSIPLKVSSEINMHASSASITHCTEDPTPHQRRMKYKRWGRRKLKTHLPMATCLEGAQGLGDLLPWAEEVHASA